MGSEENFAGFKEDLKKYRLDPVALSAVQIRLNPLIWPAELNSEEVGIPGTLGRAFAEAQSAMQEFIKTTTATASNPNLTPAGKAEQRAGWARSRLPDLERLLAEIMERSDQTITNGTARLAREFIGEGDPGDPAGIAMAQEIRSWLRSMPEKDRHAQIRKLAGSGDKLALHAIFSAPAYLSGVEPEMLTVIRDDVARQGFPDRYAKIEAIRKGAEATIRALDGVVRHIGHETHTLAEFRRGVSGRVASASAA